MMNGSNARGGNRRVGADSGRRGAGLGFSGNCICVKCGYTSSKKRAVPCKEEKCPQCGVVLLREGGYHHIKSGKA